MMPPFSTRDELASRWVKIVCMTCTGAVPTFERASLIRMAFAVAALIASCSLPLLAQPPDPDPASIENIWQKANSKYDSARQAILQRVDQRANDGPFRAEWESLQKYQAPAWYEDAKFGIFIHWGLYSVPAFSNEWYSRNMYQPGSPEFKHHVATYGPQSKVGYKDFIPIGLVGIAVPES